MASLWNAVEAGVDETAVIPVVFVRMLGDFEVSLPNSTANVKFRSRTAERLFTWLVLRLGGSVAKSDALEELWPDSDGDRQAQNLRRAVSDIRQALNDDALLMGRGDRLWLDPEKVQTDVSRFKSLTDSGLEEIGEGESLRAAVRLYAGPLLPGQDGPWIETHRMELEERFGQAIEQFISHLLQLGFHEEALRLGRHAVTVAPLREDVHVALMQAYASAGLMGEAIRQYEELEKLLSEQWGEEPSQRSAKAFESLADQAPSLIPKVAQVAMEASAGAVPARSNFYVARLCDDQLKQGVLRGEGTILVHGPRQVGKTSLLGRSLFEIRHGQAKVAMTDFQVFGRLQLQSADSFCRTLASGLATQLGLKINFAELWSEWLGPNSNLDAAVQSILSQTDGPVIWAMDEVDRLFGTELADDFFGLVRSWHNRRAMDPDGPFGALTLIISYATEAHLFIQDINQSPFNVGLRISVRDFGIEETRSLCDRYGVVLSEEDVQRIWKVTGGQPYLTRKTLDALVHDGQSLDRLIETAALEDGPFGEHLRRLLFASTRDEETTAEIVSFLGSKPFKSSNMASRLISGGMLRRNAGGQIEFRVPCYRAFMEANLLKS